MFKKVVGYNLTTTFLYYGGCMLLIGLTFIVFDYTKIGLVVLFLDSVIQVLKIDNTTGNKTVVKNLCIMLLLFLIVIKTIIL